MMFLIKRFSNPLIIILVLTHSIAVAQKWSGSDRKGELLIAGKTGFSYLGTEIYRDFSGTATEFNNLPGPYTGVEISRYFTSAFEAGAGISYSILRGQTENPDFSAVGFHHIMKEQLVGPVSYNNRLYGPEVFARFHAFHNNSGSISLFFKTGAGVLFNESELFYRDRTEDEIIFGKGYGDYKTTIVTNGVFKLGSGLSYSISDRMSLKLSANMNFVGYDFLDVVHNYDAAGNRREVFGMFTDVSAGIAIKLNGDEKFASAGKRKYYAGPHLPFSPMQ